LEPVLTDAVSSEILRTIVAPRLKAGDTPGALADGAAQIMAEASAPPVEQAASSPGNRHAGAWLLGSLGFIAVLFGVGWVFSRRARFRRQSKAEAHRLAAFARTPRRTDTAIKPAKVAGLTPRQRALVVGENRAEAAPTLRQRTTGDWYTHHPRETATFEPRLGKGPAEVEPVYSSYYAPSPSPSPSPPSDWGSSGGFDSGGGSFGGGGADSSY
jgi:uncharacterized membrane protein YgcG